ncbi:hypothetical protein EJ02DRAFT_457530 [Clathrospora elynae]|uniref:Uncharacterized protein n=1 Tax=Clathrospora elynae TaxID=706981 RepID=A0A6A5SJZ0_9PLEO|nr:hypothetical protein EJ02DRAFT_457530 [Clathrospora elynae]
MLSQPPSSWAVFDSMQTKAIHAAVTPPRIPTANSPDPLKLAITPKAALYSPTHTPENETDVPVAIKKNPTASNVKTKESFSNIPALMKDVPNPDTKFIEQVAPTSPTAVPVLHRGTEGVGLGGPWMGIVVGTFGRFLLIDASVQDNVTCTSDFFLSCAL